MLLIMITTGMQPVTFGGSCQNMAALEKYALGNLGPILCCLNDYINEVKRGNVNSRELGELYVKLNSLLSDDMDFPAFLEEATGKKKGLKESKDLAPYLEQCNEPKIGQEAVSCLDDVLNTFVGICNSWVDSSYIAFP